jgi:hypothetical protein
MLEFKVSFHRFLKSVEEESELVLRQPELL